MESGNMIYAGKYNAPDYELILNEGCDLAIESTMIHHNPEVQEKLEQFGIPVMVERSSYESHPLGRTEWMKLYAVLLGKEDVAETAFKEQSDKLDKVLASDDKDTGKTVAFFYINSTGAVNVRKNNDYVSNMIELAGGKYVPEDTGESDNALSTMNMQMEEFYAKAKDADYIIYNSTIDGELSTIDELLAKSNLLADFKAVKDGNEEAEYIAGEIEKSIRSGTKAEDIAVLFRTHTDARPVVEALLARKLPFEMKEHLPNLYEHFIAKDIQAYFRLAMKCAGRQDLLQVMNRPKRYLSRDSLQGKRASFEILRDYYRDKDWMTDRIDQFEWDVKMMEKMTPYAAIT